MLKFNLSASALIMYKKSPLQFYYTQILKSPPDTQPFECYSVSGNIVHNLLERYVKGETFYDEDMVFASEWKKHGVDNLEGFNGHKLSREKYCEAFKLGIQKLKNVYNKGRVSEEEIIIPMINNGDVVVNWKGYIDLTYVDADGNVVIIDWKTKSSVDDEEFIIQAKFYSLLYYLKHNVLPKKAVFECLKIEESPGYSFTLKQILDFKKELEQLINQVVEHKDDIDWFALGNIDTPFNAHKNKCFAEQLRREQTRKITIIIKHNILKIDGLDKTLRKILDKKYCYYMQGYMYSEKYKTGKWDGKRHIFKKDLLPIGFLEDLKKFFKDYNKRFNKNIEVVVVDERLPLVRYKTMFKENNDIVLHYYQEEAIKKAIENKIGILYVGTGGGKTYIATEIFKRTNKRSLFIVNRVELLDQTVSAFEEYLGIKVGKMIEGDINTEHQITVAGIQTITAILKRKDSTTKELRKYLFNVNTCIYDECQNVTDVNTYGDLRRTLLNCEYLIGMSGTPWREYRPETKELTAILGNVIYSKTTKELEEEGFLVPCKCTFLEMKSISSGGKKYDEIYDDLIVNNDSRNDLIKDISKYHINQKIIIIVKIVKHAYLLGELIPNSIVITGITNGVERKQTFKEFKEGESGVLIGTHQIFSTGINVPSVDVMINATGNKSDIVTIQSIGRIMRKIGNKTIAYYYDFKDLGHDYLFEAYAQRVSILKEHGHSVSNVEGIKDLAVIE